MSYNVANEASGTTNGQSNSAVERASSRRPGGAPPPSFLRVVNQGSWLSLSEYIAEAQAHILKEKHRTGTNDVSKDLVQVRVTGPDCEDLTLIDLPGIVRSTGAGESTSLVADIQSLIDDYLSNSRCVILAVHPANVDFHNSQIMADAKKVDPQTKRTLPVITKPDLIDTGAEDAVKELLLGHKTDKFDKGFHMVKCRGQKALNDRQSIQNGLTSEAAFFDKTEPWCSIPNRRLFGIKELRVKLGELQIQMVQDSFPEILEDMKSQKAKALKELEGIGEVCENMSEKLSLYLEIVRCVIKEIGDLVAGQSFAINGKLKGASLVADFHALCESFSSKLSKSYLIVGSELSTGTQVIVTNTKGVYSGVVTRVEDGQVFVRRDDSDGEEEEGSIPVPKNEVGRDASWIKKRLSEHRSLLDLPIFPSASVFNSIISSFIQEDWEASCHELLESAMKLLGRIITGVLSVEKRLVNYPRLANFLKIRMDEVAQASCDSARADLENYLEKEKKPYTQNDYLTETLTRLRLKSIEQSINESLGLDKFRDGEVISKTQVKTTINAIFNRNRKRSLDDHMAEDLQHCLDVYGKVAYKRFSDVVPMICKEILVNYARKAEASLSILPDEEKLDELIAESTKLREKYTYLRGKVSALEEGLKSIESLSL